MCGIAGFIGKKKISSHQIKNTLKLMYNRGPNNQDFFYFRNKDGYNIYLLSSRLNIVDQNKNSNQPFKLNEYIIIFNGEIYNHIKLREKLKKLGIKFKTLSDTEIILQLFILYGENCQKYMEGMWSFVIYNTKNNKIFLSRDRFGEKPFLYFTYGENFYFGSQHSFIQSLYEKKIDVNLDHLKNYLNLGYKSLYKYGETFFEKVKDFPKRSFAYFRIGKKLSFKSYWALNYKKDRNLTEQDAIEITRSKLINSLEKQVNASVPVGLCLSGGIDSAILACITKRILNKNIKTYSIVNDQDDRYSEKIQINKVVKDLDIDNTQVIIKKSKSLNKLESIIAYNCSPISTINYYNHSNLMDKMKKDKIKVSLLGTAADELFAGYYDHYLLQIGALSNEKNKSILNARIKDFNKFILKFIKNSQFKDPYKYIKNPDTRDHLYDGRFSLNNFFHQPSKKKFIETKYCSDLLRNRMLNELNVEATPVILNEDDLNSMKTSIENRSPFLNSDLVKFANTIPTKFLIKNGFNKYILREAFKDILTKDIYKSKRKIGFNSSVNDVFDIKNKNILRKLLDKKSPIFDLINYSKIEKLLQEKKSHNYLSKFIFCFMNASIFLKKFY